MTDNRTLSEKRAAAGRIGGKATGIQKSHIAKLPEAERKRRMSELSKKRWAKNAQDRKKRAGMDYEDLNKETL